MSTSRIMQAYLAQEYERKEHYARERKAKIAAMPRVRFRYGRDYETYQNIIGVWWDKNPTAPEGEFIYRKWIKFLWSFRFDVSTK